MNSKLNNKKILVVSLAVASVGAAHASVFSFVDKYDNTINATTAGLNRTLGQSVAWTTVSSTTQSWWQFDSAAINNQLTTSLGAGYQINSVALKFFSSVTAGPVTVGFYFNGNNSWVGDSNAGNQNHDPATTPFLTFNTSGQTLNGNTAVNSRFLSSDVFMASKVLASGDSNTTSTLDVSSSAVLKNAILAGSGFTIMAKPDSVASTASIVNLLEKEELAAVLVSNPTAVAPTLVIDAQPVPEPATMAALGMGALALLRRRKKS